MPNNESLSIDSVFDGLRVLPRYLDNISRGISVTASGNPFAKIRNTIAKIDKPLTPQPPPLSERYLEQWQQFKRDHTTIIDKFSLKYLCWHSETVEDPAFSKYLTNNIDQLSVRAIKGLVMIIHQNWQKDSPDKGIVKYAAEQLSAFPGRDRTIAKWKSSIPMLLGKSGAAYFARDILLTSLMTPRKASEQWALNENSGYMRLVAVNALNQSLEKIGRQADITNYVMNVLFDWEVWKANPGGFRFIVKELILHQRVQSIADSLRGKILKHPMLGDPRLPANRNKWSGIDIKAKARFIAWLSKEDIKFFFDIVLKGRDPHGRRNFWLRYVDKMVASRPLLSQVTAFSIRGNNDVKYGRLSAGTNQASFILHFGEIVAVEFSDVGKVYIYTRSEFEQRIPDMWTNHPIREERLKDQSLNEGRMIRHVNWEEKVISILAREGIRP